MVTALQQGAIMGAWVVGFFGTVFIGLTVLAALVRLAPWPDRRDPQLPPDPKRD